jgi:hypothetical protein
MRLGIFILDGIRGFLFLCGYGGGGKGTHGPVGDIFRGEWRGRALVDGGCLVVVEVECGGAVGGWL